MIFEKIKTKVYEGKLTTYYCFGKPIFQKKDIRYNLKCKRNLQKFDKLEN